MNTSRKFISLQLIGLLLLFLGISAQAKPFACPENCVVSESVIGHCDCSGIGSNSNIRIKRVAGCPQNCTNVNGRCQCNAGTYGYWIFPK